MRAARKAGRYPAIMPIIMVTTIVTNANHSGIVKTEKGTP